MRQIEWIGMVLRVGLWMSFLIVLTGGILYLIQNGSHLISYQSFQQVNMDTAKGIWEGFSLTPEGIIQLGLLVLIVTQILRVVLLGWMFAEERDLPFTLISLGILIVLIYSVFLRK